MAKAIRPEDLETIRYHLGKGVPRGTVARWFGIRVLDMLEALERPAPPPPPVAAAAPQPAERLAVPPPAPQEARRVDLPEPVRVYAGAGAKAQPKEKPCLSCGRPIPYDPHERVCDPCKRRPSWQTAIA